MCQNGLCQRQLRTAPQESVPEESPYAVLKLPDYRLLLMSRLLVTIAVQIQGIAVGWQIYSITNSPLALGLAGLTEAIPAIGVALYAGHVADIVDRRKIVLWAVASLVVSMAILTICTLSTHHNPTLLV